MTVTIANKSSGIDALPGWLKSGADAAAGLVAEETRVAAAKEASGKMKRFWLKENEEKVVTFLDGDLGPDGSLQFVSFHEHNLQVNGQWQQFICTKDVEPCPLCNTGEKSSYMGVFTVINHSPYVIKNGPNAGKVLKDFRSLYAATFTTLQKLRHFASKRNGLTGWRVEISRMADKDPKVGSMFQFMGHQTKAELVEVYKEEAEPANYGKELTWMSAAEIVKLGIGKPITGPGYEKNTFSTKDAADLM
jgi:hypothetical protein